MTLHEETILVGASEDFYIAEQVRFALLDSGLEISGKTDAECVDLYNQLYEENC